MQSIIYRSLMILAVSFSSIFVSAQRGGGGRNDGPSFEWSGDGNGNGIPTVFTFSAGVNTSTINARNTGSYFSGKTGWGTGFIFGFSMAVPVNNKLFIRPEINASQLNSGSGGYDFKNFFLDIPVLASFPLQPHGKVHLLAGPQLSLLASAKEKNLGIQSDVRQKLSSANIAALAGIEWMPGNFGIGLRYSYGLSNLGNSTVTPQYSGYQQTVSLTGVLKIYQTNKKS